MLKNFQTMFTMCSTYNIYICMKGSYVTEYYEQWLNIIQMKKHMAKDKYIMNTYTKSKMFSRQSLRYNPCYKESSVGDPNMTS